MCGIYGIFNRTNKDFDSDDWEVWRRMGMMTTFRGEHSSGVFLVDGDKPKTPARIQKVEGTFQNLMIDRNWAGTAKMFANGAGAVVGHGRHATIGKINRKNAHPFRHEHITLVHNGTIKSGLASSEEAEVDSHALCMDIAKHGLKHTLETVNGAFAVVLHDEKEGKIYIARNYERPLAYLETHGRIFIMSQSNALKFIQDDCNLGGIGMNVKEFDAMKVYVFDMESGDMAEEGQLVKKSTALVTSGKHTSASSKTPSPQKRSAGYSKIEGKYVTDYDKGEEITFRITGSVANNELFEYRGDDGFGNKIFFLTDSIRPDFHGMVVTGRCCGVFSSWEDGIHKLSYQVKTRTLVEEDSNHPMNQQDGQPNYDVDAEDPANDILETWGGEKITRREWEEMCNKHGCEGCGEKIDKEDNLLTLVYEHNNRHNCWCKKCLKGMQDRHDAERAARNSTMVRH